jgi:hypothetical protein
MPRWLSQGRGAQGWHDGLCDALGIGARTGGNQGQYGNDQTAKAHGQDNPVFGYGFGYIATVLMTKTWRVKIFIQGPVQ